MDSYQFIGFLGLRGYRYVFAQQRIFEVKKAIKLVDYVANQATIQESAIEIKMLNTLNHPNIIRFYSEEFINDEERIVLFMKLADNSL